MPETMISPADAKKMIVPIDVAGVRRGMVALLAVPGVADFIRQLLQIVSRVAAKDNPANTLVENGDVLKIYDLVQEQGGMIRAGQPGYREGANYAYGSIPRGDATIQIGPFWPGAEITRSELTQRYLEQDTIYALHETLHLAGTRLFTDEHFAKGLCELLSKPELLPQTSDRFKFSKFWDKELRKRCGVK